MLSRACLLLCVLACSLAMELHRITLTYFFFLSAEPPVAYCKHCTADNNRNRAPLSAVARIPVAVSRRGEK